MLIVEDDPLMAEILEAAIRPLCDESHIVGALCDAIEVITASSVALVLLDLRLADSSGDQTLAAIPELKLIGAERIVVVTASPVDERLVTVAKGFGADEVLGKDLDFQKRIQTWMRAEFQRH